jgi:hypothetical protein
MPVRLPRFRVRTLVNAVGLVALLFWGAMMGTRSYHDYQRAKFYSNEERQWRDNARRDLEQGNTRTIAATWGLQIADYYGLPARKYRCAMWCPWLPVDSDAHAPGFDQWMEQERRAKEAASGAFPRGLPPPQGQ